MMSDVSAMIVATGNGADHIPSTTNCVGPEKTRALINTAFLPSSARLPGQDAEDESHDKAADLEGHATLRSGTRPERVKGTGPFASPPFIPAAP